MIICLLKMLLVFVFIMLIIYYAFVLLSFLLEPELYKSKSEFKKHFIPFYGLYVMILNNYASLGD